MKKFISVLFVIGLILLLTIPAYCTQTNNYFLQYADIGTTTVDGGEPRTHYFFNVADSEDFDRQPLKKVIESVSITYPNLDQEQFIPDFRLCFHSDMEGIDFNRNGFLDPGEFGARLYSDAEYEIISSASPHDAGEHILEITFDNGQVITHTINASAGLNATEWPPLNNLNAKMGSTGSLNISWEHPITYPDDASIRIYINSYLSSGVSRNTIFRLKNFPAHIDHFQLSSRTADFFHILGIKYLDLKVMVHTAGRVSQAVTATHQYAIDGYTITPAIIPIPDSAAKDAIITLKKKSINLDKDGTLTAEIKFPTTSEDYLLEIDPSSLVCQGAFAIETDLKKDKFEAKFNILDLEDTYIGDRIKFTIKGNLYDGTPFKGSDYVKVMVN